tara:strand:- start:112 stop:309 length:198 start_codon:yes stop_codon:yes gene_type:complete
MARDFTNLCYELVEDNYMDKEHLISWCLNWLSEDDVQKMVENNAQEEYDIEIINKIKKLKNKRGY